MQLAVEYAFTGLPVKDRNRSMVWYERLLGRPPTFVPNDIEAVWQLAATASLYVIVDEQRAGGGIVTLVVGDLRQTLADLKARGIDMGGVEEVGGAGFKATTRDPDGNVVALVEIAGTPGDESPSDTPE